MQPNPLLRAANALDTEHNRGGELCAPGVCSACDAIRTMRAAAQALDALNTAVLDLQRIQELVQEIRSGTLNTANGLDLIFDYASGANDFRAALSAARGEG